MLGHGFQGNCSVFRSCLSFRCLHFSMILLQLRFFRLADCLPRCVRDLSKEAVVSKNPLLGEYTGLNFQVSAQHVEEAIPYLVKETDKKFTEFETIIKGL